MTKAFIFDYDDTLVKTRESKFAAIRELSRRVYSHELSDLDILKHWGKPFRQLFSGIFTDIESDVEQIIDNYLKITDEFPMQAYPDAIGAVKALLKTNFVGVVTSSSRSVLLPDLQRCGFPVESFSLLQTSDDSQFHKPDPQVFSSTIEKLNNLNIKPKDVIYVGDSIGDFYAASGAGFNFVGIIRKHISKEVFDSVGADSISTLTELLASIQGNSLSDRKIP